MRIHGGTGFRAKRNAPNLLSDSLISLSLFTRSAIGLGTLHVKRGARDALASAFTEDSIMAARLPYTTHNDLAEGDRAIWDRFVKERGQPGHIHRTLFNAPNLAGRFSDLAMELRNGTQLDPKLRELALMTVGRLTDGDYEFEHHWNICLRLGVKREQLEHLADFATSPLFNDQEKAVMRYAAEATQNLKVSDAAFNALRSFLDNRRIMELVLNVAFYNAVVRVLVPCGVEIEPGFKRD
jgi:alkylhydroperoxidase family enzyme